MYEKHTPIHGYVWVSGTLLKNTPSRDFMHAVEGTFPVGRPSPLPRGYMAGFKGYFEKDMGGW